MKDLFGLAILDYQTNNSPENIFTSTSISDEDEMEVAYLFRDFDQMPKIEQEALNLCYGKVLDVGCGAGSHSLYLQNTKGLEVKAIDISSNAVETCKLRGLKNVEKIDILDIADEKFDTILLLMNGTGIFQNLENLPKYLNKLKSLLTEDGQILIDSSDLIYMYDEDEDGGKWIPSNNYYGELTFHLTYKSQKEEPFPWLYLDYERLENAANSFDLQSKKIIDGLHFDYLAQLK